MKEGATGPSFRFRTGFIVFLCEKKVVIFEKRVPELTELALSRFLARARRAAGLKGRVDILITSDAEMQVLNRRFFRKNAATDVLSFPVSLHSELRKTFAGEIAISADMARRNARALGHGASEEVKILVLHGVLHLRGYDHERDDGQMARREAALRAQFRLPVGLIERESKKGTGDVPRNGRNHRRGPGGNKVRGAHGVTRDERRKA